MRVRIRLERTDLENGVTEEIADTPALMRSDCLTYFEKKNGAKHEDVFGEEIVLKRNADISSETVLKKEGIGECAVHSPYGTMKMDTILEAYEKSSNKWIVEYRILSGQETVSHQKLEWKIMVPASK